MEMRLLFLRVGAAALLALLCGCKQSKNSQADPKAIPMTPQQVACVERVANKQMALNVDFATRHMEALSAQRSTVELTLAERRANEELCLEYANCFGPVDRGEIGLGAVGFSAMFTSCLREVECEI